MLIQGNHLNPPLNKMGSERQRNRGIRILQDLIVWAEEPLEVHAKRLSSPNDFVGDPGFSNSYNLGSGLKHTAMTVFESFARASFYKSIFDAFANSICHAGTVLSGIHHFSNLPNWIPV